jgi:hypothetical protein
MFGRVWVNFPQLCHGAVTGKLCKALKIFPVGFLSGFILGARSSYGIFLVTGGKDVAE